MPRLRSWLLAPALSGSGSVPGARAGAGCGSGSRARTRSQASQRPENDAIGAGLSPNSPPFSELSPNPNSPSF
ncbi:unnamed protein product [Bursaphelenchus xylophilus]|uniref:(pine wood nematode) hypothetical protein n=1 Tax=Bursaphelenchus xylophilus TaxID=6326 RepID=A0A811LBH0_BURXY|nr:unnamed protein product [Bursaphelenchus xylophilus]CAG9113411.1 unnamed protein product [Bursaphelenchus xylophilus]